MIYIFLLVLKSGVKYNFEVFLRNIILILSPFNLIKDDCCSIWDSTGHCLNPNLRKIYNYYDLITAKYKHL